MWWYAHKNSEFAYTDRVAPI